MSSQRRLLINLIQRRGVVNQCLKEMKIKMKLISKNTKINFTDKLWLKLNSSEPLSVNPDDIEYIRMEQIKHWFRATHYQFIAYIVMTKPPNTEQFISKFVTNYGSMYNNKIIHMNIGDSIITFQECLNTIYNTIFNSNQRPILNITDVNGAIQVNVNNYFQQLFNEIIEALQFHKFLIIIETDFSETLVKRFFEICFYSSVILWYPHVLVLTKNSDYPEPEYSPIACF